MRIIAVGTGAVAPRIAERLGLPLATSVHDITSDGFVLDGTRLDVADARALDVFLHSRASEVDAVLWVGGENSGVIDRYSGRVITLNPADPLESALDGLRELLISG